jgi:hypothetical protein
VDKPSQLHSGARGAANELLYTIAIYASSGIMMTAKAYIIVMIVEFVA